MQGNNVKQKSPYGGALHAERLEQASDTCLLLLFVICCAWLCSSQEDGTQMIGCGETFPDWQPPA
jgi:hypothetical protein